MLDEIAAQITVDQLGCTLEELARADKLMEVYHRNFQRVKYNRKLNAQRAVTKRRIDEEKKKHPNRCFCREEGVDVDRNWESDGILGYITMNSYTITGERTGTYQQEVYRCSVCGKGYIPLVAS